MELSSNFHERIVVVILSGILISLLNLFIFGLLTR